MSISAADVWQAGEPGDDNRSTSQMWDQARVATRHNDELMAAIRTGLLHASTYTPEKVVAVFDATRAPAVAGRFVVYEHPSPVWGVTYEVYDTLSSATRATMNDVGHTAQGADARSEWVVDYVGRHAADALVAVLNAEEDALRGKAQE